MARLVNLSTRDPLLKGIHLVEGRGNAYIFEQEGVMVDTGAEGDLDALEILPPVEYLLLTHLHPCHSGGLKKVCNAYSPKVFCSEASTSGLLKMGVRQEKIEALRGNETLRFGELCFRAIPSPGHSADSVAFYETGRSILITGDTVLTEKGEELIPRDANLGEWAESLRFLSTLKVSFLLPGHGKAESERVIHTMVEGYAFLQGLAEGDPLMGLIAGGIQFADLGMMREALNLFDEVLKKEPENPGAAFSKGLTLLKMSKFKEAEDCFDLALRVVPDFKEAANAKALAQSAAKGAMPRGTRRGR